ncbi:MAG: hypothetical protein IKZ13_06790, partial [Akkermansia sp.]|nr:hypothetical protein [Akkermansia sp.]
MSIVNNHSALTLMPSQGKIAQNAGVESGKIKCDTMRAQKKVPCMMKDGIINSPKPKIHSLHEKHQNKDYYFS